MHRIIKHFDVLTKFGLKVIPLRQNTKIPMTKNWFNLKHDESRGLLERYPNSNIGLLLGDIVDVEGDSEHANEVIIDLIGDVRHPVYKSSKSTHHLFLNPDPSLTIVTHQKIEFRGRLHQSVLPPSTMANGVEYQWLKEAAFPIPPMPDRLLSFYNSLRDKRPVLKPGHMKIACHECRSDCFIHRKRFNLELAAFKEMGRRWHCQDCRKIDLRPLCRELRKSRLSLN
jgi:hypothetical protein